MKPFLRKLSSIRKNRADKEPVSSSRPGLTASKKTYAKVFAVGLLVSAILILAPTVFLSGAAPQKPVVGGGGGIGTGLKPTYSQATAFVETPAVRDLKFEAPTAEETEKLSQNRFEREKNAENAERVKPDPDPRKNGPFTDPGINNFKYPTGPNAQTNVVTNPIVNFLGPDADAGEPLYGTRFIPPDTNAAVGPNHIIAITNMGLRIYDKAGNPLTAQFRLSTLLTGIPNAGDDDGDPVVLYDQLADRWIISQFNLTVSNNSTHQHIAVSKTGDPTGAYWAYSFDMTANRPADYPHMGVWHDGYYMATNDFSLPVFSAPFQGAGLYAFERNKMLLGDPAAKIIRFNTGNTHGGMLPTNLQGYTPAPAGTPNLFYEFDADEFGATCDLVRTFAFHADFNTPANSTLTQGPDICTTAFDARTNRMQEPPPGEDLDGLNDRLMHAVNFRVLPGGVQSYVLNFTVNVSGVNPTTPALYQGGVRWMEMRRNAGTGVVTINQQATYAPGSGSGVGRDLWMAAVAQDGEGNIGLSASATAPGPVPAALNPTAIYTGRLAGDPVNTLPQGEVDALSAVAKGIQLSNSFNRWGDYSSLFIDPADDCTFWAAMEYVDTPNASFDWNTRIFSFKVNPTCVTPPRGTINGTITNCVGGAPIPNAVITMPEGFIRQSSATGQFSMTVPPGTYTVTVAGPPGSGFGTCTQMVTVAANGTATVNCCLAPSAIIVSAGATLVSESCTPANGVLDPGETVTVSFCVQNTGGANTTNLVGTLQATGGVTSPSGPQNYGVVVAGGPPVCRNFTFTVNATCGGTVTATIQFQDGATNLGNVTYTFTTGAAGAPITISYSGPPVAIPDSSAAGVNIPVVVSGVGNIADVNFRIDGSSCNTNNPSLTVGVDHSWVGDLKFTLTAPAPSVTSVVLMNRPGGGTFGSSGNNFCQTLLDDDGAFPNIQTIASTGAPPLGPPYTGTFNPASPLSAFDGQNANGTWTLNVSDNAAGDTGFVRAFSLIITPLVCATSCGSPCTITCPANITKSNDPNQCGAVVTYPAPTTTGTCGTVNCSPASGSFFPVGTTTVTCTTTAGPSCTFTVTVNDTQPPTITCPANITAATANVNDPCTVVNYTTTASDNCPGVTVVCTPPSGSCFPVGTTTVTCTATDASGNTATCSFTVSVFNGRLQDDSEGCNNTVLFNTLTGDYRWCCHGTIFTGRGKVLKSGNTYQLVHNAADRRVQINLNAGGSTPNGNGSLQFPPGTTRCTIADRDIRNDTCLCGSAPPPASK
jgi:subtilisin-like proprotein convertase family protein